MKQAGIRIGFIGAGKVAAALALRLREGDYKVAAIASRRDATSRRLAASVANSIATNPQGVVDAADLVFITTPDAAIRETTASLKWRPGQYVVHTSGAETAEALNQAAAAGALVGSLHPLQTFADAEQARLNLPGSVFAIEAEGELREVLTAIVEVCKGVPVFVRPEDKALYHAAAVLVSNYTVALTKVATDLWLRLGIDRHTALKGLLPLLRGTVNNLEALGLPAALTGPVARGEVNTIERHLEALESASPELVTLYRELGLQTIPVALARGELDEAAARKLRDLFEKKQQESVRPGGTSHQ